MNNRNTMVAGKKSVRVSKAGTTRKRTNGKGIRIQKVVAALFLFSFFVFTLGVVGYVIFFGGFQV